MNTIAFVVLGVFCAVIAVISFVLFVTHFDGFYLCTMIVLILLCICSFYSAADSAKSTEALKTAQSDKKNYKVFLDGKEVEWDSIDFDMYEVKVNTEKKIVYCSKR